MAKKVAETEQQIIVPALEIEVCTLKIVGDTPLITHAWDEKTKKQILDKQMKKATKGRDAKNPFREFITSLYWLSSDGKTCLTPPENATMDDVANGTFGFKTIAFKSAAVDGGYYSGVTDKKTITRAAFHIVGEYAVINGTPQLREDSVKIAMGTSDLRYRAEFPDWSTTLTIRYNKRAISIEQIANLLNVGGFSLGVGEWRPQRNGTFGMFHVE